MEEVDCFVADELEETQFLLESVEKEGLGILLIQHQGSSLDDSEFHSV